jgi:GTPase SAR1 family protein
MERISNTINNELILLKLARWTDSFSFVNDVVKVPFVKLLCHAVYEACSTLSVWTAFVKTLAIEQETLSPIGKTDTRRYAKIIKKQFAVKKRIFAPRLTYKYLLIAEVCYIHALFNTTIKAGLIDELCSLLSITQKGKSAIIQYVQDYLDPNWMIREETTKKWKGVSTTIPLLDKFVQDENDYYQLPRRNISMFSTMSAGKSTFINALLGYDYLPSKNEACTAKIASISDIDHIGYCLGYAIKNGKPVFCGNVDPKKMLEWNNDSVISEIRLEGNLDRISGKNLVTVIHDTPGVNYSGNPDHKRITLEHLVNSNPDIIICILDATQMHTTDFSDSLDDLKKANEKGGNAELLFIINKADNYDYEKESLEKTITDTVDELEKHGFENSAVVPVSSRAARLFKMALHGRTDFTDNEIDDFVRYIRFFTRQENNFGLFAEKISGEALRVTPYASTDNFDVIIEGKSYKREKITQALFNTGITVIENILNTHKEQTK